jgi:hypothetical protein
MLDMLDVIKHDPRILQISSRLHSFDQMHPRSRPHFGHLENKHLIRVRAMFWKLVLLNVGLVAIASEHSNAVHDSKSSNIHECGDVVLNAWGTHIFVLLENRD